jgi:hypothetical protein
LTRARPITPAAAAIVDGSQVNLTWNDVSTSVSGYSIEQLMPDGVTWQEVQMASATASSAAVIGNFDPPSQYAFQVVAYQEMDEPDDTYELDSQASNRATVAASAWPVSPTGLTATPVSNAEIGLTWAALANATSCEVDRTTDGQTWTTLATLGPGATGYNDTGLPDGTMCAYRVRATNSVGGSGYAVDGASTLPTAPGNLEGTAVSGTEVDLSWNAAAYATGYTISMEEEGSGISDVIGTVPASQTTFAAAGLAPGGTVPFRWACVKRFEWRGIVDCQHLKLWRTAHGYQEVTHSPRTGGERPAAIRALATDSWGSLAHPRAVVGCGGGDGRYVWDFPYRQDVAGQLRRAQETGRTPGCCRPA